jgi:hypothetical protein
MANALSVKFVGEMFSLGNFDDVLGISPLPKTL